MRRKRPIRKTYRRRYKRYNIKRKSKIGGYNVHKMKLKSTFELQSSVGGQIINNFQLTTPVLWDGTNTLPDWTSLSALYDSYRITGIRIKYIPHKPNDTSTNTNYRNLYQVIDYDDQTALGSISEALQFEKVKILPTYRQWSCYYRVPKLANMAVNSVIKLKSGMMDIGAPQTTGVIKQYSEGNDASDNYGTMVFTYYIIFSQRR